MLNLLCSEQEGHERVVILFLSLVDIEALVLIDTIFKHLQNMSSFLEPLAIHIVPNLETNLREKKNIGDLIESPPSLSKKKLLPVGGRFPPWS